MDSINQLADHSRLPGSRAARTLKVIVIVLASLCAIPVVAYVGLVTVIGAMAGDFNHHAKDAELMQIFAEHRATFEHLVSMSDSDSAFGQIAPTFTRPDMPYYRWNAYRAVFDTLHLADGLSRYGAGDTTIVRLYAWCRGFVFSGSCKGYAFSRVPLSPLTATLDDPSALPPSERAIAYRAIAPTWYLAYDW